MEASRKHGSFDMRWALAGNDGATRVCTPSPLRAAEAAETLDWYAFSSRHFPGLRRHDAEARSAYATYRQGREWRTAQPGLRLVAADGDAAADEQEREEAGTQRLIAAMAAVDPRGVGPAADEIEPRTDGFNEV